MLNSIVFGLLSTRFKHPDLYIEIILFIFPADDDQKISKIRQIKRKDTGSCLMNPNEGEQEKRKDGILKTKNYPEVGKLY